MKQRSCFGVWVFLRWEELECVPLLMGRSQERHERVDGGTRSPRSEGVQSRAMRGTFFLLPGRVVTQSSGDFVKASPVEESWAEAK